MLVKDSGFSAEQTRIEIVGNAVPTRDGYDIPIDTGTMSGKTWVPEEHFNALEIDDNNVVTNGKLSRSGKALLCTDIEPLKGDYGLVVKKK